VLIDDVTKCCWKDLFPLLLKMAQFDLRGSMDQNSLIVQQMNPIIDRLNGFAKEQNVGVNSRLEQLKSMNAFELSGVAREQRALPGSDSFLSDSNHTYNSTGGYASSSGTGNSGGGLYEYENVASPSFNTPDTSLNAIETSTSTQSTYSTFNMLQTASHAPPPPTLEQLENATQSLSLTHSGASTSSYNNYNTNSSNPFGSAFDAPLPPPSVQSTKVDTLQSTPSMPTYAPPPPPTPQSTTNNAAMTPYGGAPTNQWQLGQSNSFHGTSTPSYDNTNGGKAHKINHNKDNSRIHLISETNILSFSFMKCAKLRI